MSNDLKMYTFYMIHCDVDERKYIGCTSRGIKRRWSDHISAIKTGPKTPFHKEAATIGIEHFYYQVLDQGLYTRKTAVVYEEKLIKEYNTREKGFNGTWARVGENAPWYGKGASNDNFTNPDKNPSKGKVQDTSKPVLIDGTIYVSMSHAARRLGVCCGTIKNRVTSKSEKFKHYSFLYTDDD